MEPGHLASTNLLDAIELTMRTFEARARIYRNLVIVVSFVLIAVTATALITANWAPLLALSMLLPLVGGYVHLDGRKLSLWREEVLGLRDSGLSLELLHTTLSQFKHLPEKSIRAMLAELPNQTPVGYSGPTSSNGT